jgi:DNA-binding NarL/FixJ family response regulator
VKAAMPARQLPAHRSPPEPDPEAVLRLCRPCGCPRFELTDREEAVLELLAEGWSTEEAARSLYVSRQAITYHVGNLLAKFQCANRTGLVARAFVIGVLEPTWPPSVAVRTAADIDALPRICGHRLKDLDRRRTLV